MQIKLENYADQAGEINDRSSSCIKTNVNILLNSNTKHRKQEQISQINFVNS